MSSDKASMQAKLNKAKKEKKKRSKAKKEEAAAKRVQSTEVKPSKEEEEDEDTAGLVFEDPFEDEFEEEEVNEMEVEDEDEDRPPPRNLYFNPHAGNNNNNNSMDEPMEFDPTAYGALHQMKFDWPALSFDFFRDHMGQDRTRFPTSVWFVAGTQALESNQNGLNLIRVSNLCRTKENEEDMDQVLDDEDEQGEPTMESKSLSLVDGAVNRVRAMPQESGIVALWSESGRVHLYDARKQLKSLLLETSETTTNMSGPVYTMTKHKDEGYAMDWSPCHKGRLATGDCKGSIFVWDVAEGRGVELSQPYLGHKGSVEDLQFSPSQENYLASCGVDGSIKIWDTRLPARTCGLSQAAHDVDVNVLAWNPRIEYLLASGSDDASFKVWDLRRFEAQQKNSEVAWFKGFHTDAITSIQWSPHDESVIACCSADHQTTVWDMALEEDLEFAREASAELGFSEEVVDADGKRVQIPPQLLFVHSGVRDPKEVRFHPQVTGLIGVTGESGFDLFLCEPLDPKSQLAAAS